MSERPGPLSPPDLRSRIRDGLPGLEAGLRALAEELPALDAPIDILAIDADGRVVAVLIAKTLEDDDALLFTRALATRAWLMSRLPGWLQMVPGLEVTDETPVRCLILANHFRDVTRAAAASLRAGVVDLAVYRIFQHGGDEWLLLEHLTMGDDGDAIPPATVERLTEPAPPTLLGEGPQRGGQRSTGDKLPTLRSGLRESDFALTSRELASLEGDPQPPSPRFDSPRGQDH